MKTKKKALRTFLSMLMAISLLSGMFIGAAQALVGDGSPGDPYIYDGTEDTNFPVHPAPGGVTLGKTSSGWLDMDDTKTNITLSVKGQPMPQGVDVVLVLDTSQSMSTSVPLPTNTNLVSGTVTLSRDSVSYRSHNNSNINDTNNGTNRTGRVSVTFTAYFDKTSGQLEHASDFSGVISSGNNNTNNNIQYYRYNGVTYNLGGTNAASRTSNAAKDFYQAVFAGSVITVGEFSATVPTTPTTWLRNLTAPATTSTTRLAQMKIAAGAFLDEMFAPTTYVDANGVTQTVPSDNRVALVDFGLGTAARYQNGTFIGVSGIGPMKTYINNRGTTGGTNYVSALDTTRTIVNSRGASDRPIYVVFMSDGEPRGGTGSGNPVAYSTTTTGTGDAANINNARINLHSALDNTGCDNGVFTVGYMITGIAYASEWLNSITKAPGTFTAASGVADIEGVFVNIAKAAKKAGTNAKVVQDVMGKAANPFIIDASGNPTSERVAFNVDMDGAFTVKAGSETVTLYKANFSHSDGVYTATYTIEGRSDGTIVVDTKIYPNKIEWDFGDILEEEITLTYPIIIEDCDNTPTGLYFTNNSADLVYQNYLGNYVSRPFPIPQLPRPANSIRVIYFAANADGNAISSSGAELSAIGGRVNTIQNILSTEAIILDNLYLDVNHDLIHPTASDDISLGEGNWTVSVAESLSFNSINFDRVVIPESFLIYDVGTGSYTQNTRNPDNPYIVTLPDASNGTIILVGYKPEVKLTVYDQYGSTPPEMRVGVVTPPFGTDFAQQEKKDKAGYAFESVDWAVSYLLGDGSNNISKVDDKVNGTMPFANVVITYYYKAVTTSISGEKLWVDADDTNGLRPDNISVILLQNGDVYLTDNDVEPDTEGNWYFEFTGLPKYDDDGDEYIYAIDEVDLPDYDSNVVDNEDGTFTITNTLSDGEETLTVTKVWNDSNNTYGTRPLDITYTVTGYVGSTQITTETVIRNATNWGFTLTVPKYSNQQLITYTVTEAQVPGYNIPAVSGSGYTFEVTNSLGDGETDLTVQKVWNDSNNADGTRPALITYTVTGYVGEAVVFGPQTATGNANDWGFTLTVPKYSNQQLITYTVTETQVPSYNIPAVSGSGYAFEVTNTLADGEETLTVTKVWNDSNNSYGTRPLDITYTVTGYVGSTQISTETVVRNANDWGFTLAVPKYSNQQLITYTVTETQVPGYYIPAVSGSGYTFEVTNTLDAGSEDIEITKVWVDNDNGDDTRTAGTITLMQYEGANDTTGTAFDTMVLDLTQDQEKTFTVPVYSGNQIKYIYKAVETSIPAGYSASYSEDTFTVTNTLDAGETEVTVSKLWVDRGNETRPESITFRLHQGNTEIRSYAMEDPWEDYTFDGLPMYNENQQPYAYTVTEDSIPGYTTAGGAIVDGVATFTNTLRSGVTSVEGEKVWRDNNDSSEIRPESITVILLQDNEEFERKTVSWPWSFEFDNLPMYTPNGQHVYEYTVDEVVPIGYIKSIEGTTIINTRMDSFEGELTVYKVLLDVDGNIIDENHEDYYQHIETFFNVKLTDNTDSDIGEVVETKGVQNDDSVVFDVNDVLNSGQLLLEEVDIGEGYELVEILPIYWSGNQGVTTVVNRVFGNPNIEPGQIRVVKYVVHQGRLLTDNSTVNATEFGVTAGTRDAANASGTIIIETESIIEAIAEYFREAETEFDSGIITAVLSGGDLDGDLIEAFEDAEEIEFSGMSMNTTYLLQIVYSDEQREIEEIVFFEEYVTFTDNIICNVSAEFIEAEVVPNFVGISSAGFAQGAPLYGDVFMGYEQGEPIYGEVIIGYEQGDPIYGEVIIGYEQGDPIYDIVGYDEEGEAIYDIVGSEQGDPIYGEGIVDYEQGDPIYGEGIVGYEQGDPFYSEGIVGYEPGAPISISPAAGVLSPEEEGESGYDLVLVYSGEVGFGNVAASGTVRPNDETGLLFEELPYGLYQITEPEDGIPVDFSFYGMKLGNAEKMERGNNGLEVYTSDGEGSVVIIFNEYGRTFRLIVQYYANGVLQSAMTTVTPGYATDDTELINGPNTITVGGLVYSYNSGARGTTVTFVDGDITVQLYYTRTTTPGDPGDPGDDPYISTTRIGDPEPPLSEYIPEPDVPLADLPPVEEDLVIVEEDVPLSMMPQTGRTSPNLALFGFCLSILGLGITSLWIRKEKSSK